MESLVCACCGESVGAVRGYIISTVVSGDSVQQNDLRGQVDLIGPGS